LFQIFLPRLLPSSFASVICEICGICGLSLAFGFWVK
jgi:hypothetical protein